MIEPKVLECVRKNVGEKAPLNRDTALITSGLVDSLAVIDLITSIEKEFGVQFTNEEMTPDNFDSVAAISAVVSKKLTR
ncbi:MAG: acyl carrier protein [Elusimicrobia bacterium]|nr:acyl carrier protein [Elusimicrobiota bacterium]